MAGDQMQHLADVPVRGISDDGVLFGQEERNFHVRKITNRRNAKLATGPFDTSPVKVRIY